MKKELVQTMVNVHQKFSQKEKEDSELFHFFSHFVFFSMEEIELHNFPILVDVRSLNNIQ